MREEIGDLWLRKAHARVIPTNGQVGRDGRAVMGAGVAKQAATRCPGLDDSLGYRLQIHGNHVYRFDCGSDHIVTFPTKHRWRQKSDLALIERSAKELARMADQEGWLTVVLPRVGCGLGQRDWVTEVKPILERHLVGDKFVVVHLAEHAAGRAPGGEG